MPRPKRTLPHLKSLAEWCTRYAPLVATDVSLDHGLWLDVTGCAHPFGGEQGLLDDLSTRLGRHGIPSRSAVAGASGTAWALARCGDESRVLASGKEAEALQALPVAALRLESDLSGALRRLGLRTIGELARLPRDEVTARFGSAPVLRLDQALGREAEAIAWRHEAVPWFERMELVDPICSAEDLGRALVILTDSLCHRLQEHDQGCRRFTASFFRVDTAVQRITIATGLATRDAGHLTKLFREKLDTLDPGFGVDAIFLHAACPAALRASQARMSDLTSSDSGSQIVAITDAVANRIGAKRVWRMAARESHVPERVVTRLAALSSPSRWAADPSISRPIRLLRHPQRLAVTSLLPDEPPVAFCWRGVTHRVRAATGPERITAEWWRRQTPDAREESDLIRDYYKVEDVDGARFWVFRAGLLGSDHAPVWYMHGLFA